MFSQALTMRPNDILVVVMTKSEWYLKQVTYSGGMYPELDLYPEICYNIIEIRRVINKWI